MPRFLSCLLLLVPLLASASPLEGRWRLDKARSSALDGWTDWDLTIAIDGPRVTLGHDMQWRSTKLAAANVLTLNTPARLATFFRVEQRHMAVYPAKGQPTTVQSSWLDGQRTLRVEAETPVEISQGQATLRIYAEYRLVEGDRELVVMELHSTRPRPLVYRFRKVTTEN